MKTPLRRSLDVSCWIIGGAWILWLAIEPNLRRSGPVLALDVPGVVVVPVAYSPDALSDLSRVGPRPSNSFEVGNGVQVIVLDRGLRSVHVELPDRRRGWVYAEWVKTK